MNIYTRVTPAFLLPSLLKAVVEVTLRGAPVPHRTVNRPSCCRKYVPISIVMFRTSLVTANAALSIEQVEATPPLPAIGLHVVFVLVG